MCGKNWYFVIFMGFLGIYLVILMKMPILQGAWGLGITKGTLGLGSGAYRIEGLMCMVLFGKWVRHTVCMGKGHTKRGIEDISYGMSFLPLLFLENNQFIMMDNKCLLLSCKGFDLSSDHSPCKGINQRLHLHLFLQ